MTTIIFLFALGFLAGVSAQQGRLGASPQARKLGVIAAVLFSIVFVGYAIGKELALRDNLSQSASATPGQ